ADERRRVVDHAEPRRIIRLADGDQGDAEFFRPGKLALGQFTRVNASRLRRAAAARQPRERFESGPRAAAMIDQAAEGARADVVTPNEAQPVEPLLVSQAQAMGE